MRSPAALLLGFLVWIACTQAPAPAPAPAPDVPEAASTISSASCTGVFRWLQKDAYADRPGRASEVWPPHTTTVLEVWCGEAGDRQKVEQVVMVNHGGPHDETDESGRPRLEEVLREERAGTRVELMELAAALRDCECATEFLGLETLQQGTEREMIDSLSVYAERNLVCPGADQVATVLEALRGEDFARAVDLLAECTWRGEGGAAGAFDEALGATVGDLETYHVCNNDAISQARLWRAFRAGEPVARCDPQGPLCRGPLWIYDPAEP